MNFQQLFRKHWVQGVLACIVLFAAFISLLPIGIKWFAEDWYKNQGVESVTIEDVDFNLFTGVLELKALEVKSNSEVVFSIDSAEVNVSWLALFSKHIHVQSINFRKLFINVEQFADQPLMLAGISLGTTKTVEKPESGDKPEEKNEWGFGITDTHIENLVLKYTSEKIKTEFVLLNADLKNALTWTPDKTAVLELSGEINNSPLLLSAELKPFSSSPEFKADIKINGFAVKSIGELGKPGISKLSGKLFIDTSLELKVDAEQSFDLKAEGKYRLLGGEIELTDQIIETEDLAIVGSLDVSQSLDSSKENKPAIEFSGNTELKAVSVVDKKRNIKLIEVVSLALNNIDIKKLDSIFVDTISVGELTLAQEASASKKEQKQKVALVTVKSVETGFLQLEDFNRLILEKVDLNELVVTISRDKEGKLPLLEKLSADDAKDSGAEGSQKIIEGKREEKPFQYKIGSINVSDKSRFLFEDASVVPKFVSSLLIQHLEVQNIENIDKDRETTIKFKGKPGKYSQIDLDGKINLVSAEGDFSFKANIDKYDLPLVSSYTSRALGYDIESGLGDFNINVKRVNENIDGKLKLVLHKLAVRTTDPKRMEELDKNLSIPLGTALSMLRDKNDDIKLTIPVTGKLLEPNIDVGDVINTALAKAMKASSVSYLKYIFQPYGTFISIVELAGEAAGSIRLDPIIFDEGKSELDDDHKVYLKKMVELMRARKEIRVNLCGISTEKDRAIMQQSTGGKVDNEKLSELAKKRAENIKDYLVANHDIGPARLFVCHPQIKDDDEAKPKVDLVI